MSYLIKIASNPAYWSGKEDAVWVDQTAEAKEYATKKEAEKDIKEISESSGYSNLEAVKAEDAVSADIPVVVAEEVEEVLSVEDLKRLAS